MLWAQADLFHQLTIHGLLWAFAMVNATLWKLPSVLSYTLAPKHLILSVAQNNPHIWAKSVTI
jgi:hypothetical protein